MTEVNNKRIFKNTVFLYLRMFIVMFVGLFTSRVILQTLGIDDYGIYNIVGGIVVLFSFINNALRNATQRYISYELGKKKNSDWKKVLHVSVTCHIIIAVFIVILAETMGLWFLESKLNIPADRMDAARVVYQFTILTFVIHIFQVPYNAAIISHEKMSFYAYVSIIESILKLLVAYAIVVSTSDKLIVYAAALTLVSFIVLLSYIYYCRSKLDSERYMFDMEKGVFKGLMSFSGYSMFNGAASLFSQQGCNIFINMFNGVAANAAFGVASQASSIIYSFVSNFQSAFQPQIVKLYASDEEASLKTLLNRASNISYYLLLIIAVPFCLEADYVLHLWLGIVPEYTAIFCVLLLLFYLIEAISAPLWMLIYATGRIKFYTIWSAILVILNLPVSWVLLKLGYPIYIVFVIRVIINVIIAIARLFHLRVLEKFDVDSYMKQVILPTFLTTVLIVGICLIVKNFCTSIHPLLSIVNAIFVSGVTIWIIGLKKTERLFIINYIKNAFVHKT